MTRGEIRKEVVAQRAMWVREMVAAIRTLPLEDAALFLRNPHQVAAAESYLRRALEALLDLGRHILAKRFGFAASEYKMIAGGLEAKKVLVGKDAELMYRMAGYRNRMVHFYHEISAEELYEICRFHVGEIEEVLGSLLGWLKEHEIEESINQPTKPV